MKNMQRISAVLINFAAHYRYKPILITDMKTSFYFVVWILVYPLLGLDNPNTMAYENSFLIAILAVFVLSWLLKTLMPKTHVYEKEVPKLLIFEDAYQGNVEAIKKRLTGGFWVNLATAAYTFMTVLMVLAEFGQPGDHILELAIFALLCFASVRGSYKAYSLRSYLGANPDKAGCEEVVEQMYVAEYETFKGEREQKPLAEMMPPRPAHYKGFLIFSTLAAAVATILGVCLLLVGFVFVPGSSESLMNILYGSLASYFGIRDMASCAKTLKCEGVKRGVVIGLVTSSIVLAAACLVAYVAQARHDAKYDDLDEIIEQTSAMLPKDLGNYTLESVQRDNDTLVCAYRIHDPAVFEATQKVVEDPRLQRVFNYAVFKDMGGFGEELIENDFAIKSVFYDGVNDENAFAMVFTRGVMNEIASLPKKELAQRNLAIEVVYDQSRLPFELEDGSVLEREYVDGVYLVLQYASDFDIDFIRDLAQGMVDEALNDSDLEDYAQLVDAGYGLKWKYCNPAANDSIELIVFTPEQLKEALEKR